MNQFEHWVYDRLKDNLRLKELVKRLYQRAFTLIPGPQIDGHLCELEVRPHAFYGFHDKNPWSRDRIYLLGHRFTGKGHEPWLDGAAVDICIHQGDGWRETVPLTTTHAWNWQQGAQLQWLGNSHCIIFNDIRDGLCSAVIHDLENNGTTTLPYPVAAVSPDGQRYAAICFETLTRAMPGYGYGFAALVAESPVPALSLVISDLQTSAEQWIHFVDLDSEIPLCAEGDGVDFFSYCLFSPNGRQLLFLRRQALPNRRLRSELFCITLDNGRVYRLPFKDMVSHFTWLGNGQVLAYANTEADGDGYYRVDVQTGCVENLTHMLNNSDGHPHAEPEGGRVVFDTYPDRRRYQHLYVWDADNDEAKHVARVYAPLQFSGDARVDLHPRLDALGEYVCFDAGFNGVRSQVTARLT